MELYAVEIRLNERQFELTREVKQARLVSEVKEVDGKKRAFALKLWLGLFLIQLGQRLSEPQNIIVTDAR